MSAPPSDAANPVPADDGPAAAAPDPRYLLANERTMLAWSRTALAFVAAGVAVTQFLPTAEVPGGRRPLGVALIIFGAVVSLASALQSRARARAITNGEAIDESQVLAWLLAIAVVMLAAIAVVVAVTGVTT